VHNLRLTREYKKQPQKNPGELSESYLSKLAEAKVLNRAPQLKDGNSSHELQLRKSKELKELIKRERKKRQYRKIGRTLRDLHDN
jgi:hypothetical protein